MVQKIGKPAQKRDVPVQKLDVPEKKSMGSVTSQYEPYIRVGYAYVPYQEYGELFTPEEASMHGTLFPELYIPWGEYVPEIEGEHTYEK